MSTVSIHRDDGVTLANRRNPQCKQILGMFNEHPVNKPIYVTSVHTLKRCFVSTLSDVVTPRTIIDQLAYNFA